MNPASERYSRHTMLPGFGPEGQRRLAASSVLVVGLGGLGAPAATYLAAAGVGRIGLCDPDCVSLSNLQRQVLYDTACVGHPKTDAARARLAVISPDTTFEVHPEGLTGANARDLVSGYDLMMDCTDNFATRYLLDEACAETGRPWIYGSIGEFNGQVALMNGPVAGIRYADLYPGREELCALPHPVTGVLGPVPGVIGSLQACEALKFLSGCGRTLDGRLAVLDLLTMQFNVLDMV